jgi:hypothetical protein
MDKTPFEDIQPGTILFDTHDSFRLLGTDNPLRIREPHRVISRIRFPAQNGCKFIQDAVRQHRPLYDYVNKCLVVMTEPMTGGKGGKGYLYAAYSSDNEAFGTMEIEVDL